MPEKKSQDQKKLRLTSGGFTLIELMLVIMIISGMFVYGIVRYRDFQRRQALESAARTLIADLRFAQEKAMAGTKPAACDTLNSYVVNRTSSTGYRVLARCGSDIVVRTDVQIGFSSSHPGITIGNFSDIVFNVLGRGVSSAVDITLTQANTNATRTVSVSTGGDIK